jgi:hypothetical protein
MINVKHFSPRFSSGRPPFPLDEDEMVESMKKARLNDDDYDDNSPTIVSPPVPLLPVEWEINTGKTNSAGAIAHSEDITVCAMGVGGGVIVGAGAKGSVWLWKGGTFQSS